MNDSKIQYWVLNITVSILDHESHIYQFQIKGTELDARAEAKRIMDSIRVDCVPMNDDYGIFILVDE